MTTERTNSQWILKARPEGMIDPSIFEKRTVAVPELSSGQVLAKILYLSFDPTQRGWISHDSYMPAVPLGDPVRSGGLAQVVESKHSSFQPGDIVSGLVQWQEYVLFEPDDDTTLVKMEKLPGHLDPIRILSLVPTGITAYFGMLDVGKVKAGDAVLVSGAAGATGSVAGQIAKIKGASKVVGIAGSPEKCKWLVEKANFDAAIDYKSENVGDRIKELFPDGVDVFFDNVGGQQLDAVLLNLALNARIVMCGAISQYNVPESDRYGLKNSFNLIIQRGTAQGFIVTDFKDRFLEAILCLNKWIDNNQIQLQIDMKEGFDNIPSTLERLFAGANRGKQMLKLCDAPLPFRSSMVEKVAMSVMTYFYSFYK